VSVREFVASGDRVTALWCELAWLGGEQADRGVLIELDGERIASVSAGVTPAPSGATSLAGITIPGLANAHSHAFQRALRGRTQLERGDFWTWRRRMYEIAEAIEPDACFALARATFAEMALAGFTAVGEFHYLHHGPGGAQYADPNAMGNALIDAAAAAGLRITLLDSCYLQGGIDRDAEGVQLRFSDGSAEGWSERVNQLEPRPGARIGAAIHSVRAVDPDATTRVAAFAAERSWPLHAHVSEQSAENEDCVAAYGKTPTGVLAEAGALSERFTAVHATHLVAEDFELLGGAGCAACLCPTTERDLADGVGPARRLAESGVRLCLGTDSHAMIDPFEEARAIELDERLESGQRGGHSAAELLRAATAGGCVSIGWPEAGRIAPGALADLVTVGLEGVRLAGTGADHALESVVFAGTAADVRDVIVGGRFVVRDGAHMGLDVAGDLAEAVALLPG
jgi:formiminoglutamate deiminase